MEIFCPTCLHPIELDLPEESSEASGSVFRKELLTSVHCPNCGLVQLPSGRDETLSWRGRFSESEGATVAHFSLVRLLGEGASGRVWLADDTILQRKVALKLPQSRNVDAADFVREAQTAAHLRHSNIVSVYEVASEKDQAYIASEYVEGLTLRDLLSSGTPAVADTAKMMTAVARALHYAHTQGIVHRDVKPSNILVNSERQPFVTDFGLAKRISCDETISSEGQILGTARYMSPEQASGKTRETDQRSDIYAIGVILFEMLTGHVPYRGSVRALLHQKVTEDAPSPRKLVPGLPKDLETICLRCLERDPGRRYQSAKEVADELERFSTGEPIRARPISSLERGWRWCRRRPAVAGLLASLILSLTVGLAGVSYFYWQAARSADLTRRSLYRSQMNLASEYFEKGDISGVRQTLNRVASDARLAPLRGFEWRYFEALIMPFTQIVNRGEMIADVAVSAKGDLLAAVSANDRSICIWDAKTSAIIGAPSLQAGRFRAIAFSPRNKHLLSGSSDGMLRLWDPLQASEPLWEIKHGPPVALVQFSPDGQRFLSAGASGAVRIWDIAAQSLVAEIPAGKSGVKDVRFSADGKSIAIAAQDGRLRIVNVDDNTTAAELPPDRFIESIAFSDDGKTFATGSFAGDVRIWSTSDWTPRHTYETHTGKIGDLEFVKGTALLAFLASDGQLHLYDTALLVETRELKTHNLSDGVLARAGNGGFFAVGSGDGTVKLLRVDGLTTPSTFWHATHVRAVGFLPDGKRLVAADGNGGLRIWNVETNQSQDLTSEPAEEITTLSVQPQGNLIALAGLAPHVALWDVVSGKQVREIPLAENGIAGVAFSSSGRQLAIATRRGGCFLYEAEDWSRPRWKAASRKAALQSIAFSQNDRDIALGYENGEIDLLHAGNGTLRDRSLQIPAIPLALAFCGAANLLAIGTDSGQIYLYDLAAGRTRTVIKAHTSRVNALAVLPGGSTFISGGRDRELKLWDTSSGELLTTLAGHVRQVFSISVSSNGETIASGGLEGDVRIWRAAGSPTELP